MMVCFRPDEHLTDEALTALVQGTPLTELERLELAEHLSYCDQCLQRYTELLAEAQVICEAFDRPEEKSMLVNAVLEKLPDAYLVASSGMAGLGSANSIRSRRVAGRFYLCGDGVSGVSEETGLFSTRAALCAAHQAHMVLRILAGEFDV